MSKEMKKFVAYLMVVVVGIIWLGITLINMDNLLFGGYRYGGIAFAWSAILAIGMILIGLDQMEGAVSKQEIAPNLQKAQK